MKDGWDTSRLQVLAPNSASSFSSLETAPSSYHRAPLKLYPENNVRNSHYAQLFGTSSDHGKVLRSLEIQARARVRQL